MKVIGLDSGRVTLLTDILELSPDTGMYVIELVGAIQDKFGFATLPKLAGADGPQAQVLKFEHGRHGKGHISVFEIHPQGLVVQSLDTRVGDAFLDDLFAIGREFGIKEPSKLAKRIYGSGILIEFENDISGLISKWGAISNVANEHMRALYSIDVPTTLSRIAMRPDPESLPPRIAGLLLEFTLERRVYAPYTAQRYYSTAPLPTDRHISFLKSLDDAALARI